VQPKMPEMPYLNGGPFLSCGHFALFIRCNSAQGEKGFPALPATDQLFALGNVSNCNEILEIAPYEISGDHHEQMQTVAEGNFVFAAPEGTFGGKPTAFFDLFCVDNGKVDLPLLHNHIVSESGGIGPSAGGLDESQA
jgi:hypothetical protein